MEELIGKKINRYEIKKYIGSGSFGDVFEAVNNITNERVALKIPVLNDQRDGQKCLLQEAKIYKEIANPEYGIANMKITKCKDRKIIVMDLLGASLENLLTKHKRFGLQSVIYIAMQMLEIIKYIHNCGYIHRDLKPDNFVIGKENMKKIYCIDFGLASKYVNKNNQHIKIMNTRKFCGTARYASIAAHKNIQQSRKDDLEAIGYLLVYFYRGKLPWQDIKHKDKKERYKLIGEKKESMSEEEICKNMPREFVIFLKYVRNLDFDEKPHYTSLQKMFEKLYISRGYKTDKLEWI
jgi:serine/threonine protein kinase